MRQLPVLFLLLCFTLIRPFGLSGQSTLHLIISYDNGNQDIRQGCQKDFEKTRTFFSGIARDAGMGFQLHTLRFSQEEVYNFFTGFKCGSEDAVIFFYTGHGFRQEDDQVIWPFLYYCVNNGQGDSPNLSDCGVPLDWIHQMLISKQPRMSITLGNSCNVVPGQEEASPAAGLQRKSAEQPDESSLQNLDLLTKFRGHILASGASPGQFSYTNDDDGSYFVNELIAVLSDGLLFAEHPSSWASMLKKTRDEVQKKKPDQRPQFLIVQDGKKMYSEGQRKYQNKASYEILGVQVPEVVDDDYYQNWETEDFDQDDYAEEWEEEYDMEENEELALEDLPYILVFGLQLDDGRISQNEFSKALGYYQNLAYQYAYDRESAEEIFRDDAQTLYSEQQNGTSREFMTDVNRDFKAFLKPDTKNEILEKLANMADNPNGENLWNYIQTLRQ